VWCQVDVKSSLMMSGATIQKDGGEPVRQIDGNPLIYNGSACDLGVSILLLDDSSCLHSTQAVHLELLGFVRQTWISRC
jgi:hypothetical protein